MTTQTEPVIDKNEIPNDGNVDHSKFKMDIKDSKEDIKCLNEAAVYVNGNDEKLGEPKREIINNGELETSNRCSSKEFEPRTGPKEVLQMSDLISRITTLLSPNELEVSSLIDDIKNSKSNDKDIQDVIKLYSKLGLLVSALCPDTHTAKLPSDEKCNDPKLLEQEVAKEIKPTESELDRVRVEHLSERIGNLTSPDDLEVSILAAEIKNLIVTEDGLEYLVQSVCDCALSKRSSTSIIAAVCGLVENHHIGKTKLRSILLSRVQTIYKDRVQLEEDNRFEFVTSAVFLAEIFHKVKTEKGYPFKFLAKPVMTVISMIIKPHLSEGEAPDVDEDSAIIAKQLLQSGAALHECDPSELSSILIDTIEVMVLHGQNLSKESRLNLLAAHAELWPLVNLSAKSTYATLATKLNLVLNL